MDDSENTIMIFKFCLTKIVRSNYNLDATGKILVLIIAYLLNIMDIIRSNDSIRKENNAMELKLVKVVNQSEKYTDKSGKEHVQTNYYVVVNGSYIAIRPSFKDDYRRLDLVCDVVKNA